MAPVLEKFLPDQHWEAAICVGVRWLMIRAMYICLETMTHKEIETLESMTILTGSNPNSILVGGLNPCEKYESQLG